MVDEPNREMEFREAVGVFMDVGKLEHAIQELLTDEGFDQSDISLLGGERSFEKLGRTAPVNTREEEDDPDAPRISWAPPEARTEGRGALAGILGYLGAVAAAGVTFATGGAAAIAIAAGLLGGGATAALGVGLGSALDHRYARQLESQIAKGGILLWVRVRDNECERRAAEILRKHGAEDVHVHTLPATGA